MGILENLFTERRGYGNADDFWYTSLGQYTPSKAGVMVDDETAMRCATVYACVRVLAESIASLPIHLYKRLEGGGKERAAKMPLYRLMHAQPHPQMSAYQWVETAVTHLALTGNHFSEMVFDNRGQVAQLNTWNPSRVEVEVLPNGSLRYTYQKRGANGQTVPLVRTENQVLHIPGLAWDGVCGLSPISYARETIGLAVAAEEFGARFFGSGTNMGHIMSLPEGVRWDDEHLERFRDELKNKYEGLGKTHKVLVLPNGMQFDKVGIPPDDAQFLETRKFQKAEIASIFRVPLHLIQEHEKNTTWGSGIEHMNLGFVIYTLRPWLVRIEQILNRKLLTEVEQEKYYFEFLVDALLRGDQSARAEYFTAALQNGWLNRNEVREIENRNPVEGGDEFMTPLNMNLGNEPPNETLPGEENQRCACGVEHRTYDGSRQDIQRSFWRVIVDAMARVIRRERNDIMAAAKKTLRSRSVGDLSKWIGEFYTEHEEFTREQIEPAFRALAEAIGAEAMREISQEWQWSDELEEWLRDYINAFANRHSNRSRGQLQQLLEELQSGEVGDLDEAILDGLAERFEQWEFGMAEETFSRPQKIAGQESVRLGQGFTRAVWGVAGVVTLTWLSIGESCPYCDSMSGRTVGIERYFLPAGADLSPGGNPPLRPSTDIYHPPCHAGCDCVIVPGG
jgi:HK97 family phage portal protein